MATNRHKLADDDGTSIADAIPHKPAKRRYPCFAEGCPMPGTIFPDSQSSGVCAYHYAVLPSDIPRVTAVLLQWDCVSYECREARRVLTGELAADPGGLERAFKTAWERLQPLAGEWADHLKPGNIRSSKGVESPFLENYGDWAKRLEAFLGGRVRDVLSVRQRRQA